MRRIYYGLIIFSLFMGGCSRIETVPELYPLLKHGDFYVGVTADGNRVYLDFNDGELVVIGAGRTALEKYSCETPKLVATAYSADDILTVGGNIGGEGGIALGNLYITDTEIIIFNFLEPKFMERIPIKKTGVVRINNYEAFADKQNMLWTAVNDVSEYKVTIDSKENPVLYKADRIIYYVGEQVFIKNVTDLYEEPTSFKEYYEHFIQDQTRINLLRKNNNLNDFICIVFDENFYFVSDSGHLMFSK